MSWSREESNKVKQMREGIVEQRPLRQKSKKDKRVFVEFRNVPTRERHSAFSTFDDWRKWKGYRNNEEAQKAMDGLKKKHAGLWEFRLKTV